MSNLIPLTLEWFPKDNDYLAGEETCYIDLDLALQLMEINKEKDPTFAYDYKVPKKFAKKLQTYYTHKMDLEKYNYFVGSYTQDTIEPRHVKYLDTDAWKVMKMVFKDLQEHRDIKCILKEDYVIGFILDILKENKVLSQDSLKPSSKSH